MDKYWNAPQMGIYRSASINWCKKQQQQKKTFYYNDNEITEFRIDFGLRFVQF